MSYYLVVNGSLQFAGRGTSQSHQARMLDVLSNTPSASSLVAFANEGPDETGKRPDGFQQYWRQHPVNR